MYDFQLITDIQNLFKNDWQIIVPMLAVIGFILYLSYKLPEIIFRMYEENAVPEIQTDITDLIYKLDEFADDMSNEEKREKVITKIQELLTFNNGAAIPHSICGMIVDMQVRRIRQLQKACKTETDLHK
jgi:hypothetical protein